MFICRREYYEAWKVMVWLAIIGGLKNNFTFLSIYIYNRNFWTSHNFSRQHNIKKKKKKLNNPILRLFPFTMVFFFKHKLSQIKLSLSPSNTDSASISFLQLSYWNATPSPSFHRFPQPFTVIDCHLPLLPHEKHKYGHKSPFKISVLCIVNYFLFLYESVCMWSTRK